MIHCMDETTSTKDFSGLIGKHRLPLTVKKATMQHAQNILEITKEAFLKYLEEAEIPGTLDALTETIEDVLKDLEGKAVFIAEVEGVPAGSIRVAIRPDNTAYISRFGVLRHYQNIGIGRALIEEVFRFLKEKGINDIYLHTAANYTELVTFYKQNGFEIQEITCKKGYPRALMVKR